MTLVRPLSVAADEAAEAMGGERIRIRSPDDD